MRQNIASGTRWEPVVGYSRAVRVGTWCTSRDHRDRRVAGQVVGHGDAYAQGQTLRNIEKGAARAGARSGRTMYVTRIDE
jgi:hypothetical protein